MVTPTFCVESRVPTPKAARVLSSSPSSSIAIAYLTNKGILCQPCRVDDAMETSQYLNVVHKTLQRIQSTNSPSSHSSIESLVTLSHTPVTPRTCAEGSPSESPPVGSMSFPDLASHLISLRTGYIPRLARPVLQKFMFHQKNAGIFNAPVDPVALDIPTYPIVVTHPMDLGTVKHRLQCGHYTSLTQCFDEIRLTFTNAMLFNASDHFVHLVAKDLLAEFEDDVKSLEEKCVKENERKSQHKCNQCRGSACSLCGEKCLKLETPTLFCYVATCGQRIKKHATFFISPDGTLIWCQKCYIGLPAAVLCNSVPGVPAVAKKSLLKRRFEEEIAEPWEECDKCGLRCHQICALTAGTVGGGAGGGYASLATAATHVFQCPMCVLAAGKKPAIVSPLSSMTIPDTESHKEKVILSDERGSSSSTLRPVTRIQNQDKDAFHIRVSGLDACSGDNIEASGKPCVWKASTLPRTQLSDFMEACVKDLLTQLGHGAVKDSIHIRMTSNYDNRFEVPSSVRENFQTIEGHMIHEQMAFRQKCIQLFQTIDGIDVCVFCLYVHEFDATCPAPNQSSVYIAYLDSVDYFRPSSARTWVYQEVVVAYLKWSQARGFKQCHLWSCPPQRGDNFIFWCHPSHQRTPSRDRLNSWYHAIFHRCRQLQISRGTDKFWNAYFSLYQVGRREEVKPCRQAAKNSFVGSGKASNPKSKSLPPLPSKDKGLKTSSLGAVGATTGCDAVSSSSCQPICPPIFDGDYWMLEFVRLYRGLMQKDPLAGGPQSLAHHRWCKDLIKSVFAKPMAAAFRQPVDPVALGIPLYPVVIKNPMDLGTVREKLRSFQYSTILEFVEDVRLTFKNATVFNPEGHFIHAFAKQLLGEFEKNVAEYVDTCLASFFPLDHGLEQILQQCRLGTAGEGGQSASRSRASSVISLTAMDSSSVDMSVVPMSRVMSCEDEVEAQPKAIKQVKIVVDSGGEAHSGSVINPRKRCLSRTISDDASLVLLSDSQDEYDVDADPRSVVDTASTTSLSSFTKKMRRGSMDSLSTTADFEDTFEILAEEGIGTCDDFTGRASLGTLRAGAALLSQPSLDYAFSSRAYNQSLVSNTFTEPALAQRALHALVSDLSKGVQRMSDDLFVVRLADPRDAMTGTAAPAADKREKVDKGPVDIKKRGRQASSLQGEPTLRAALSSECLAMLTHVPSDTTDPDPVIRSPLVDSRYTFLETCQYRHFQFDSLRRAKSSSLMMLYNLHKPYARNCRPLCTYCGETIFGMRWHCDQCADFDICDSCKVSQEQRGSYANQPPQMVEQHSDGEDTTVSFGCGHVHPLTPYRVTFR